MNESTWNTADRELLEQLCHDAKVPPDCANQPWNRLSDNIRQRICEAWALRK